MRRRGIGSRRHRWQKSTVEVPWSSAPANLYTCGRCKMTRQSIPLDSRRWKREFGILQPDGKRRYVTGRTPPCEPREEAAS